MFLLKKLLLMGQVRISEHSKGTYNVRRAVGLGDVEMLKMLISMLIVLQIPFRLLLAQSYSSCTVLIDNFMFSESNSIFMFSGFMSFGTKSIYCRLCMFSLFIDWATHQ